MIDENQLVEGRTYWYGMLSFKSGSSFRLYQKKDIRKVKAAYKNNRWNFLDDSGKDIRSYYWYGSEIICETEEEANEEWNAIIYKTEEKLNSWVRARKKEISNLLKPNSPLPMVQNASEKA